ncbi:cation diffusion facilitator family transporter [Pseudohaliea rubra]|uniref:Cation-efflux pump FieF n=1 Tax=Pseudohaliea rubra DSM 19751 TaxID=1265313 RepID=A0A095VT81_9GAMM|nr:cation diffusion facilitator family transporter [Pseudohaliea rubra]KGE04647.1 Cobalt-zinc-cadmium resistance protein [Pseudohaliea rubra DSM 19751]
MSADTLTPTQSARLLKLATNASVLTAAVLILVKALAYWETGSVSILASFVDSLMDSGASLLNLIAVRYALAPADRAHRFGHGKAESIAALGQGTFIIGSGLYLIVESVQRLLDPQPLQAFGLGVAVMAFTIGATAVLLLIQGYVIRRTHSAAIRADSLHYRTDLLTNSAVLLALVLAQLGWPGMDPVFALAVALYILSSARRIMGDAFSELLDRELPEARREAVLALAEGHPEVRGVHDLRTRSAGRVEFMELHLELDDHLPLIEAHRIADEVADAIRAEHPAADVVIHQDPVSIAEPLLDQQIEEAEEA